MECKDSFENFDRRANGRAINRRNECFDSKVPDPFVLTELTVGLEQIRKDVAALEAGKVIVRNESDVQSVGVNNGQD
jgi:hypothetical protein